MNLLPTREFCGLSNRNSSDYMENTSSKWFENDFIVFCYGNSHVETLWTHFEISLAFQV